MLGSPFGLLCSVVLLAGTAAAQDRLDVTGDIDLRWVHATGDTSYLNGGLGVLRFDPSHEGVELGRAFVAPTLRLTDTVTLHAVFDAYGDYGGNPVDISEFFLDVRPFPSNSVRWRARVGAFFMPVSLENRGAGWTDVYSITPSAVNTWMGEEFRTIGAEVEARWLGASTGYLGDVALVAATYGWNDEAGELLADRGFALTDRPSTLFGGLGKPPIAFYHEIDHRPGYYGGVTWRHHDRLEVRVLRYDNRGDPGASTPSGDFAWRTRFTSAGARLEPSAHWTFVAQYLNGDTAVGADTLGDNQFLMRFQAGFALGSFEWAHERISLRYDDFHTHQVSGFYGPPSNDTGHSWTLCGAHEYGDHWQFLMEWLHLSSSFPPRLTIGSPEVQGQSQLQVAVRYKFRFGV
jgi:hypothetical protein